MKTLVLNIPDSVELDEQEATMLLDTRLYERGKLSRLGRRPNLPATSKQVFMELLSRYNVPIFNYDPAELENDIRNAGNYIQR
jgi:predicted HTH domain antitoxin